MKFQCPAKELYKLNCLLANLTYSNRYSETLKLFTQIHASHHLHPDHYTLSTAVTACAHLRHTATGSQLHAHAFRTGLNAFPRVPNTLLSLYAKTNDLDSVERVFGEIQYPDVYSWTTLLSACAKSGHLDYARKAFDQMPSRRAEVWNAMITGCAERGDDDVAVELFREMHRVGVRHDNYSFASVLSLCGSELEFGRQVHSLVVKTGFLVWSSVTNSLLTVIFRCGNFPDVYEVFEEAEEANAVDQISFNVMIDGLGSLGRDEEALMMFRKMQRACLRPTELTFVSVMSNCSVARVAQHIHAQAIEMGFEAYTSMSNAAITMYSSCGDLSAAKIVFERLEEKDLVSWNTMISSYAEGNCGTSAILAYLQMHRAGLEPDEYTIGSLLASSEVVEILEMIHTLISKNGLILKIQVSNALVSAYSRHGMIKQADQVFHDMSPRNLISWNAIISGFLLNGLPMQGLEQFSELLMSELRPDVYTLSIALSICASISSLRHGKQIHGYILRFGFFSETSLGNALVTMYAKCGILDWSLRVFDMMIERDTVSWNALISAYAQHGLGNEAVHCFEVMQDVGGVEPDQATFTAVLSACSHAGLVDYGTRIIKIMVNNYGFMLGEDHFSCIVDLLGRAGYLDEAERITNSKHFGTDSNIWWTLLSACAAHGNLRLGRIVAGFILETEQSNPSVYVVLANIYAAAGQWEEAANIRELSKRNGTPKQVGCSWIGS